MILLHFALITFRFCYMKTLKPLMFEDFEPSERDHDSQNQYYVSLEKPGCRKSWKIPNHVFQNLMFGNFKI